MILIAKHAKEIQRASDGSLVQIDFLLGAIVFQIQTTLNDFAIPIGVDHRCIHCILHFPVARLHRNSDRRKGVETLGTILAWGREACFVSIRVAATHL